MEFLLDFLMKFNINRDMATIDEINKSIGLSARCYNVCCQNDLTNLDALLEYYRLKGDFLDLTNCGFKSNLELKMLCERLNNQINEGGIESVFDKENPQLEKRYNSLSREDKKKINHNLIRRINKLSLRTRNSLFRYFDGQINIDNIYDHVLSDPYFDPLSMEGVGRRSEKEIREIFHLAENLVGQYGQAD